MNEQQFSPQESLAVIQSMIEKAKQNVQDNSFYFLLWGWLVFAAAMIHFTLANFTNYPHPYFAWFLMIVGAVASIIKGIREENSEQVKTYVGDTMKWFGISLGIIYAGLAFIFGKLSLWENSFPIYILIYAVACFFMGSLMQFPLLRWAGLFCVPLTVLSVYVDYNYQILLLALAVLISYIIPGHVLNWRYKQERLTQQQ